MKVFRIPSHVPVLYYCIYKNIAICDFREGCSFIKNLFCYSFPSETIRNGVVTGPPGIKYSSSQWRKTIKTHHLENMVRIKYTKDINFAHHGKISVVESDFISFHLLFDEINNINELEQVHDAPIYNTIINTFNRDTLENFHSCGRWMGNSLLLIV
jgi:hypothetical protein